MFVVELYFENWDDWVSRSHFATTNEKVAKNYCNKYNSILKKWQEYYIKKHDELFEAKSPALERFYKIMEVRPATYYQIELRS